MNHLRPAIIGLLAAPLVLATVPTASGSSPPIFAADANGQARVLISYRQDPDQRDEEEIETLGGTVRYNYDLIPAIAATVPQSALEDIAADPDVALVEPDYLVFPDPTTPNDPRYPELWGLNNTGQTGGTPDADIDAPEAWDVTAGSPSVVVAVIDTGAQVAVPGVLPPPGIGCPGTSATHPDLAANVWVNPGEGPTPDGVDNDGNGFVDDIHGWNFFNNAAWLFCSSAEDDHGTHVFGTIGARGNNGSGGSGVNWQVQVMVLKFIGPVDGSTSNAILAIQYATNKGAKVINASWGGGGFSLALKNAIEACGCLFVAAAGNDGADLDEDEPHYPASFDSANLISVAATDHNDQLPGFSNFGATSVDLGAPGASILSTVPMDGYDFFSGTSMATPHVSGVGALILALNPALTPLQLKDRILNAVDPIPTLSGITVTGGRLNAFNALPTPTDSDGDSLGLGDPFGLFFRDSVEVFMGTLPLVACPATDTTDDEDPDATGADFDDSQDVDGSDVFLFAQRFGAELGVPPQLGKLPYIQRFDIYPTAASLNKIDGSDVFVLATYFGTSCP